MSAPLPTARPRRTPRTFGPGRRPSGEGLERERVLDGALVLLLERGPARLRLAELARQLGVVPSALHYHFPGGKDEVVTAIFDREEARALEAIEAAVAAADSPRGRLLALAKARLQNASRLARLHQAERDADAGGPNATSTAAELQDYVMRRRQGFLDRERELVSEILRSGPHRVTRQTVDLLTVAFQGALFNVTRTFALTTNREADRVLAELVDLFFLGIERHARRETTPSR